MKPQAKHIPDERILRFVDADEHRPIHGTVCGTWPEPGRTRPVFTWDIADHMADVPPKVVMAKLRSLIKRGLLDGCACGCRGDFKLTERGRAALGPMSTKGADE